MTQFSPGRQSSRFDLRDAEPVPSSPSAEDRASAIERQLRELPTVSQLTNVAKLAAGIAEKMVAVPSPVNEEPSHDQQLTNLRARIDAVLAGSDSLSMPELAQRVSALKVDFVKFLEQNGGSVPQFGLRGEPGKYIAREPEENEGRPVIVLSDIVRDPAKLLDTLQRTVRGAIGYAEHGYEGSQPESDPGGLIIVRPIQIGPDGQYKFYNPSMPSENPRKSEGEQVGRSARIGIIRIDELPSRPSNDSLFTEDLREMASVAAVLKKLLAAQTGGEWSTLPGDEDLRAFSSS